MDNFGAKITHDDLEKFVGMTNPEMWKIIRQEYGLTQTVTEFIDYQLAAKIRFIQTNEIEPIDGIRELIAAAKAAGMRCIGYVNPNSGNQDLSFADRIVRSVREIETSEL